MVCFPATDRDVSGRLGLTPEQVAALVAAKNETRKTVLIEQAKLKGVELQLLGLLRNGETPVPEDTIATAVQGLERVRSRITQVKALGYLKARQILTPEQQQRVHPPRRLRTVGSIYCGDGSRRTGAVRIISARGLSPT